MADRKKSRLASALGSTKVPKGSMALAWLGQASFVLKSASGCCIALDPYLSNSCRAIGEGIGVNMDRKVMPLLHPRELVDFGGIVVTHSHQDHVDPETIQPYLKAGGVGPFVAPHEASDRLLALGVPPERIRITWPNHVDRIGEFEIRALLQFLLAAMISPTSGYLISVPSGPKFYFTGDTDYSEVLGASVAPHHPDVMVTVINPAFGNLSPREGGAPGEDDPTKVGNSVPSRSLPDNSLPDRLLRTNLILQGIGQTYLPLKHGAIHLFGREGKPLRR